MLMYFKKNQLIVYKIRGSNWQHIWYYTVSAFLFYKNNHRVSFTHVMVNLWLNTIDAWLNLINTRYDTCINDICWSVIFPLLMFTINLILSIKRTEQYHHIFIFLKQIDCIKNMVLWFNKTTEVHSTSMNSDLFSVLEYFLLLLTSNKS